MARFQIEGDVFSNLLNGPADEHVPWYFYARESCRIYPAFDRVVFVDVQAHRPVRKANRVECDIVSHRTCQSASTRMLKRADFLSILSDLPLAAYLYGLCTVQPDKS